MWSAPLPRGLRPGSSAKSLPRCGQRRRTPTSTRPGSPAARFARRSSLRRAAPRFGRRYHLHVNRPLAFVLISAAALGAPILGAQAPAVSPGPTFEVASVKPNKQGTNFVSVGSQGNRYTATNVPVQFLIRQAFQVQEDQIVGGPGWLATDRYDIVATGDLQPGTPGAGQRVAAMLRALLADRFKLT